MQHLHPSPLVFPHKYCFHLAATNRDCSSSLPNLSGAPCRIMTSQLAGPAFILLFKSFFLLVSFQLLILVGCLHPLSLHQVQPTHQECYQGHRCLHSHAKQFFLSYQYRGAVHLISYQQLICSFAHGFCGLLLCSCILVTPDLTNSYRALNISLWISSLNNLKIFDLPTIFV